MATDDRVTRSPNADAAIWLAIATAVIVLYVPSLGLPLAFDDAWSVRLVEGYTFVDAFTRTANFGYYRPLYLLAYMLANAAGAQGPLILHALCLAAHAANAILITRLARALHGRRDAWLELGAALLYASSPFVFQAVALPAGLNHLLALLFMLIGTLAYIAVRTSGRRVGWPVCLGACVLAFFSNEIGVVAAGLCLVYEIARALRERRWTRGAWSFLIVAALSAAYLLIYSLIPKGQSPEPATTLEDVLQRLLYAAQLWSYPIAVLLRLVVPSNELAVAASAAFTALACLLAANGRWRILILAGVLIFAGAALPPLARLPAGYILNAPRALYTPLTGVAITWTALALSLADVLAMRARQAGVLVGARAAVLIAIGSIGVAYVVAQHALHALALAPIAAVASNGAQIGADDRMLALNLPEWVAPIRRFFPLGSEGVIVMAPYVGGDDLVLANTGLHRSVDVRQFALPFDPGLSYVYQLWGTPTGRAELPQVFTAATRVVSTAYLSDTLRGDWIGGFETSVPGQLAAAYGSRLALNAYHVQPCREGWMLATRWRQSGASTAPITPTLSLFAQVFDGAGRKVAQSDGAPMAGLIGFADAPTIRDMVDRRRLAGVGSPPYTLYLGLYDYQTGQRVEAHDSLGARLIGDALSIDLPVPDLAMPCE